MKLVVDTNVLFSFFDKSSATRELMTNFSRFRLYAPKFGIDELRELKQLICQKAKLPESDFEEALKDMMLFVTVVPESEYASMLKKAKAICPDPDDIDFFALALKLECAIWSNERKLRRQPKVKVLTTQDVARLVS